MRAGDNDEAISRSLIGAADVDAVKADARLRDALAATNYSGLLYDRFIDRLARYGLGVLKSWISSGQIYRRCHNRNPKIKLFPPEDLASPDVGDLSRSTVAVALRRFHHEGLMDGGWSPDGGAGFTTYLIGLCLDAFPNEFHRWCRERRRHRQVLVYDPAALPEGVTPDPVDRVLARTQVRTGLAQLTDRQRTALEMHAFGFTSREIAAVLKVAPHAVDGLIFRARTVLRKLREEGTL